MASNKTTLKDYYGNYPDWLELHNPDAEAVDLSGWRLQDNGTAWSIPAGVSIPAQGYLTVFCDDRDTIAPNGELHANFKLGAGGDYLGLLKPDGTVVSEYAPQYPPQIADISYGVVLQSSATPLIGAGAGVKVLVPTTSNGGSALGTTWQGDPANEPFNDSAWTSGVTGVGYTEPTAAVASQSLKVRLNADSSAALATDTSGAGHNAVNVGGRVSWVASSADTQSEPLARYGAMQFNASENDQMTVGGGIADLYNAAQGAIMFWMRSSGTTGTGDGAVLVDFRSTRGMVITQTDAGQVRVRCYSDSPASGTLVNDFTSGAAVGDGQWHHVAVRFSRASGAACSIWIDGALDSQRGNSAAWSWTTGNPLEIGRGTASHTPALSLKNYNGLLDDFRFYNAALADAQIAGIYRGADEAVNAADIGLNVQTAMRNVNSSTFVRVPFNVADPGLVDNLQLALRFNDGFVAWINGQQVAAVNAPDSFAYNSAAVDVHSPGRTWSATFDDLAGLLRAGTNILAIQGLNNSAADPNFLIVPTLGANVVPAYAAEGRFFVAPTPGKVNGTGVSDLGPIVSDVSTPGVQPGAGTAIVVTARVAQSIHPVQAGSVALHYRVMYNSEFVVTMTDDGLHGDGAAGDGVYGAAIPGGVASAGQMLRWYVSAADTSGNSGRWPPVTPIVGNDGGPEYEGTVIADPSLGSTLPVLQTFIVNPSAADNWSNRTGSRASVYFLGRFYDNVFVRCRGGYTTQGNKFEFNSGYDFTFAEDQAPVNEINLNQKGNDTAYLRPALAFGTYQDAGVAASIALPMHVERNNQFYQVMNFIEQVDNRFLRRNGLYEDGSLYKRVPDASGTLVYEKKTRDEEANRSDLDAFLGGLQLTGNARTKFLYDNVDLPAMIAYLVGNILTNNTDHLYKNYYLYRDTNDGGNALYDYANPKGTDLWTMFPWDMDWTFGVWGGPSYYTITDPQTHPFFGDSEHGGNATLLIDALLDVPAIKQMFLRRLRTEMDAFLQPTGTAYENLYFEQRIDELYARLMGDADFKAQVGDLKPLFDDLKNKYFGYRSSTYPGRRFHLYVDHCTNTAYPDYAGIPAAQAAQVTVNFGAYDANPASGNQDQEYLTLVNPGGAAIDISGWKLSGGIDYTFAPGTVIPAGGTLYVSPNVYRFRQRTSGPSGNQGLFVVGNYDGQLSLWGETVRLTDLKDSDVATLVTPGSPSLAQQHLRITEVMYHPADPPKGSLYTSDDFQFIELSNGSATQTLDLTGVRFTDGVVFDFTAGGVASLAPGAKVLVVANLTAFQSRYGTGFNSIIAGQFGKTRPADLGATRLAKSGEKITLVDSAGETVLSFTYGDGWLKQTDGPGNSLVIRDPAAADRGLWNQREGWFASHAAGGSPGADETPDYSVDAIVVSEVLAHAGNTYPGDWVEFHNTTAASIDLGGWYVSNSDDDLKKYQIAAGTLLPAGGYVVFNEYEHFGNPANPGCAKAFSFSDFGDTVYLTSASGGILSTYQALQSFDAGDRDQGGNYPYQEDPSITFSFGRYVKSTGGKDFVTTAQSTYAAPNSAPRVGPVVIHEINYHPTSGHDCYIELKNLGSQAVNLYDPDPAHQDPLNPSRKNAWRLAGGVEFTFPQNAAIPADGYALVVAIDPAFYRAKYGIPASVPVFGPYLYRLDRGGDSVELQRPGAPQALPDARVPYYRVDRVTYDDSAPWPKLPDGFGPSLGRIAAAGYGNDVANWCANVPTPGRENATYGPPALVTPAAASPSPVTGTTTTLSVRANDDGGESNLRYTWTATTLPPGATAPTYSVNGTNAAKNTTATFTRAGTYVFAVTISDAGNLTIASTVSVTVTPSFTSIAVNPASVGMAPGGTQQFTAAAKDQFGTALSAQPSFNWATTAGTITAGGLFTAPAAAGTVTVTAGSGGKSGTASVTISAALPHIVSWQSAADYGNGYGELALPISDDGTFSEPRGGGVRRLLVSFDRPIASATFTPAAVKLAGRDARGAAVNLSGITISTSLRSGNTVGVIAFNQPLPDIARYVVRIDGITDAGGTPLAGDRDRIFTALRGDVSGDLRVDMAELYALKSQYAQRLNTASPAQLRADYNTDGRVDALDLSLMWNQRGHDARAISDPVLPVSVVAATAGAKPSVTMRDAAVTAMLAGLERYRPAQSRLTVGMPALLSLPAALVDRLLR